MTRYRKELLRISVGRTLELLREYTTPENHTALRAIEDLEFFQSTELRQEERGVRNEFKAER